MHEKVLLHTHIRALPTKFAKLYSFLAVPPSVSLSLLSVVVAISKSFVNPVFFQISYISGTSSYMGLYHFVNVWLSRWPPKWPLCTCLFALVNLSPDFFQIA